MKFICSDCIGEAILSARVSLAGHTDTCSYCECDGTVVDINWVIDCVEKAFEEHYIRTAAEPDFYQSMMMNDKEGSYNWEREGEPVLYAIAGAAEVSEIVARDIQETLEERHTTGDVFEDLLEGEFASKAQYVEADPDDRGWREKWRVLETSLAYENRFFNRTVVDTLHELFADIDKSVTCDGESAIVSAGPDEELCSVFRARVFTSETGLIDALGSPKRKLGPPPPSFKSQGRMNAHGVALFYGSLVPDAAIAEVRPPVGSTVVLAKFDFVRPVRLLDLNRLTQTVEYGSVFDPDFAARAGKGAFLRGLHHRVTVPVMPEREGQHYLVTQAITDYLASHATLGLDGLLFRSVQSHGWAMNVALFRHASKVEPPEVDRPIYAGRVHEDWEEVVVDGIESVGIPRSYYVASQRYVGDEVSTTTTREAKMSGQAPDQEDDREVTLALDPRSIETHVVQGVSFHTQRSIVSWQVSTGRDARKVKY